MRIPSRFNKKIQELDRELQGNVIKPSNLILIILLALEIYESRK